MKKFLVLVVSSVLFVACGSSISDETRTAAADHIGKISSNLTNAVSALKSAKDEASANSAFSNFSQTLATLVAAESNLAKIEGYSQVAQDKVLREKINKLSGDISRFTNSVSGNDKDAPLEPAALAAGQQMIASFTNVKFAPVQWIRACDEARLMIGDLTKLMESTYTSLQESKNGKAAGEALVTYAASVKRLSELGQTLEKRYPDFKKAATDPVLEQPIADFRASMVKLGNELKEKEKTYKADKDFVDALAKMKNDLTSLKK